MRSNAHAAWTVFRVRTLMTDGNGQLMGDGYEAIPHVLPQCVADGFEQLERKE